MGFTPSKADADLYIREVDGHHEMIASYVDDCLFFSKNPMALVKEMEKVYTLKGVGEPEYYLGGDVVIHINEHWDKENITMALSAETYIKNSVERLENN